MVTPWELVEAAIVVFWVGRVAVDGRYGRSTGGAADSGMPRPGRRRALMLVNGTTTLLLAAATVLCAARFDTGQTVACALITALYVALTLVDARRLRRPGAGQTRGNDNADALEGAGDADAVGDAGDAVAREELPVKRFPY
ncbi:hypothetical protein ABZ468_35335 [Streptomyces sp. NPDC005708]|uniref:hypothetical protein n=1 Tax=Streptomyces sp. NPDC005708 TaxID=3154564 RepID=UPI0033F34D9E